jgi:RNA polymerase sigma-70 factor (ECF subfamily)
MSRAVSESEQTDEQLAAMVAERDSLEFAPSAARDAFERLYRRHTAILLAFLAARVRNRSDTEDLHQEVWKRVWSHLPDRFHGGNFRAWLFEIARNALTDHARKRKPESLAISAIIPDIRGGNVDDSLIEAEKAKALERCLEKLSANAAAVVRARLAGDDYPEICARLGLKQGQAYKLMNAAKNQLETCVERALG